MKAEELKTGAEKYGTPLYLFDTDELLDTAAAFKEELTGSAGICFAMKANPFLTGKMADIVERIEVCSMGEYEITRILGITPEKILISGVLKEKGEIRKVLDHYKGRCAYTVESANQFYSLADWCEENHETLSVYVRLSSGNQFGMDEAEIQSLMMAGRKYPFLKIKGLHYFSGTQKKSAEKVKKELLYLDEVCIRLGNIEELEYGPGIPAAYFKNQENEWEAYIREIKKTTAMMKWKGRITLEMGRALTASCGYYLTRIRDIKQNNGKNYCIVDGGIHQLQYDGQIRGMYCPKFRLLREAHEGEEQEWTICGSLCTVNDVLIQNVKIPGELKEGDILVFENTGAYAPMEGMALFLSHELPAVAAYGKNTGWRLLRKKQSTYQWNMDYRKDDK